MGAEFAARVSEDRRAASGMEGIEVADPYVERLLEGFAFIAARIQLKIDAEFPRFTQHLLEIVYPHYLAPTPSMLIVEFRPDPGRSRAGRGRTPAARDPRSAAPCRAASRPHASFRTAHACGSGRSRSARRATCSSLRYLPLAATSLASRPRASVRIALRTHGRRCGSGNWAATGSHFFLAGIDDVSGAALRTDSLAVPRRRSWSRRRRAAAADSHAARHGNPRGRLRR